MLAIFCKWYKFISFQEILEFFKEYKSVALYGGPCLREKNLENSENDDSPVKRERRAIAFRFSFGLGIAIILAITSFL